MKNIKYQVSSIKLSVLELHNTSYGLHAARGGIYE